MEAINDISTKPLVSVIMPVRNEARFIGRALTAIFNQTYRSERMEVVVADGMSTDGTRKVIERDYDASINVPRILDSMKSAVDARGPRREPRIAHAPR